MGQIHGAVGTRYCIYKAVDGQVVGFKTIGVLPSGCDALEVTGDEYEKYSSHVGCLKVVDGKIVFDENRVGAVAATELKKRDDLLHDSRALRILPDSRYSDIQKAEVLRVRAALFDISSQDGWPFNFKWPELDQAIMGAN